MITSTGKDFDPFNPKPEDIDIEDIARGLSRTCRFAGQLQADREYYSVAQHSVIMTKWAQIDLEGPETCKQLLLHDASEAYLGDIVSPNKYRLPGYCQLEAIVQDCIFNKFLKDVDQNDPVVKKYDKWIVQIEAMFLMPRSPITVEEKHIWKLPSPLPIYPQQAVQELWYPNKAYEEFMELWKELNNAT